MILTLSTPVKDLKGVGPSKAAALARLGIVTVDDLLHHYPSGYYFAPPRTDTLPSDDQPATMGGVVRTVRVWGWNFEVDLDTGIKIVWYGSSYLRQSIFKGSYLMISGIVHNGRFINPEWRIGADVSGSNLNTVTYPVTSGITSNDIGRLVRQVFEGLKTSGTTPPGDRFFYVYTIHRPVSQAMADGARKWLKREELFYMQLGLAVRQARRAQAPPNVQCVVPPMNTDRYFPFTFTQDQAIAAGEILADLCRPRAMNRLLQGDVGCGKTAVAAYAAIVMAFNGRQTAILCPTEILARQHYETVKGYFERAGVKCCLMAGGYVSSRDYTLVDIVVGTTAIIADNVRFKRLGLVIIDEQHRFGVEQRAALRRHGNPHVLVMTATPIPRTIAMTVFGDLDVSTIKSMPPGRRPVETVWVRHNGQADRMRVRMEAELAAGRQVYVVCPRIEALDDEMRAVEEVWGEYRDLFPHAQVNYLHGKMTPAEKQLTVGWWVAHTPTGRILVSTTVVEVGVDNPNAAVMVIEGAERFGLAQLHQLRGRVGRGPHQSYCFLLSDTDSTEAKARLRVMERTNDGFEVAEADLRQRGPGDLLSPRQHGLPDLKIADLVEDYDLLVEARKEAREMVAKGPLPASVQAELEKRFGKNLDLGDAA